MLCVFNSKNFLKLKIHTLHLLVFTCFFIVYFHVKYVQKTKILYKTKKSSALKWQYLLYFKNERSETIKKVTFAGNLFHSSNSMDIESFIIYNL
ncbi:hypothetical protein EG343_03530 [Chryseobacterium nakagawai]|uniref:Uncharacterized protein n=1 Tax=Chryseobacterium nakagawai TaxID=1241982 RepID=A0AAD1DPH3_CHRNA|nr:hypothetical protein EG343_03530 [Chryseobacterium nakagawai]